MLISAARLEGQLADPALRVLDCTVLLHALGGGGFGVESGRQRWEAGHIPGSAFADLAAELSDPDSGLRFTMPSASRFSETMGRLGVGSGTNVVLYDSAMTMWAARVWWMLRAFGFDDAAVLDGGWRTWRVEGRPVSTDAPTYAPAQFDARLRPELIADKEQVLVATVDASTYIVDALAADQYTGETNLYGRAGHIPSAANVPAVALVDSATHAYRPLEELRRAFADASAADTVITYCGGGIAASSDAFVLTLLGHQRVAVYDGSLNEWAADPALPLEVGEASR